MRLKDYLEQNGIKKVWFASELGISGQQLNGYVHEHRTPNIVLILKIQALTEGQGKALKIGCKKMPRRRTQKPIAETTQFYKSVKPSTKRKALCPDCGFAIYGSSADLPIRGQWSAARCAIIEKGLLLTMALTIGESEKERNHEQTHAGAGGCHIR